MTACIGAAGACEMITVSRRELKYVMSRTDSLRLQGELNQLLEKDCHSENGYYAVRSLYFDSLNNIDYFAKQSGEERRKKLRLRIYNCEQEAVKFELKEKEDIFQQKTSLTISRGEAAACIEGRYEALLKYGMDASEIYSILTLGVYRPSFIIEYQRRAYTFPAFKVRVTFDTNLKSSREIHKMWSPTLSGACPLLDGEYVILEVKYDRHLPESIKKILARYHLTNVSFSKYENGHMLMKHYA